MTGLYVIGAISAVLALIAIVLLVLDLKKRNGVSDTQSVRMEDVRAENERLKNDVENSIKVNNIMITGAINAQANSISALGERMDRFAVATQQGLANVTQSTQQALAAQAQSHPARTCRRKAIDGKKHIRFASCQCRKHKGNEAGQRRST